MGINISFFKTPKYRVFHYDPIYYDERKERLEEIMEEAEREKAIKEGREYKSEKKYIPGRNIRGKIRESSEKQHKRALSDSTSRIIGVVALIIFFVMLFYFAEYYSVFLEALQRIR